MPLANARAAASLGPPAGVGTINRIGLLGYVDCAATEAVSSASAPTTRHLIVRFI